MTLLWLMLPLAIVIAAIVAWPWLRRRLPEEQVRRAANVAAYRTRIAEVDADVVAGKTDAEAAEKLRHDAGIRLLADEPDQVSAVTVSHRSPRALGIVLALVPVVVGVAWYAQDGSWRVAQEIATGKPAMSPEVLQAARSEQIQAMVQRLRDDLKSHSDDEQRWALLGRSELVLKNYSAAAQAYARANSINGSSNPEWLVAQGLAQGMVQQRNLRGEPTRLFDAALKIAPDDVQALWYAGVAAAQRGDTSHARQYWGALAGRPGVPDNVRTAIEHQIAALDGGAAASTSNPSTKPSPDSTADTATPVVLDVEVRLAPELANDVPQGAILFVFVRAVGGPPMPLAADRIAAPHFPVKLRLDDTKRPMPGARLEGHDRFEIVARLSRNGDAKAASGDIEGTLQVAAQDTGAPLTVTLNHRVP
ncbi:MAG: c-type cytochrome biogenesis protein CcmI [Nevskiaceae bacterium]|nr:MAG: c-type cytochrome biogenesis protein CcmI [Nevskiaceae bacterium]TBR73907.1 MAG: c-type cytochrome biogenesis protein CcmI [Nevskiaceae bacterium]